MSRITAVYLFLENLRRITAITVAEEELREIYAREFITHPDGGAICSPQEIPLDRQLSDFSRPFSGKDT